MHIFYRKKRLIFLAGLFFVLLAVPLCAQTAARLETLLNESEITWQDAAMFVLEASDAGVFNDADEAFGFVREQNWLPKNTEPADAARLNGIALLLMKSFDIKGGIFYRIAKSPHHAYRELVFKGIIRGSSDPDMVVSGQQLLLMVNRLLSITETDREAAQ